MRVEIVVTPEFARSLERQARPIMEEMLGEIRTIIDEQSEEPKSGRSGPRRRRSAPGESPAKQTGALVASITDPQVFKSGGALVGQIRITAPYAVRLQRGSGRIAPRPIARPAVEEFLRRRA